MLLAPFSLVDEEGALLPVVSVGAVGAVALRCGHGGDERLLCCIAEPLDEDGEQAIGIGISAADACGKTMTHTNRDKKNKKRTTKLGVIVKSQFRFS